MQEVCTVKASLVYWVKLARKYLKNKKETQQQQQKVIGTSVVEYLPSTCEAWFILQYCVGIKWNKIKVLWHVSGTVLQRNNQPAERVCALYLERNVHWGASSSHCGGSHIPNPWAGGPRSWDVAQTWKKSGGKILSYRARLTSWVQDLEHTDGENWPPPSCSDSHRHTWTH